MGQKNRGIYFLLIQLNQKKNIKVGSLGRFEFQPGKYCYVGSGMNNLDKRVERHLSDDKKKHWHIDYFLDKAEVVATVKIRTDKESECLLNRAISILSEETPVENFGSSDCGCKSHLHLMEGLHDIKA